MSSHQSIIIDGALRVLFVKNYPNKRVRIFCSNNFYKILVLAVEVCYTILTTELYREEPSLLLQTIP